MRVDNEINLEISTAKIEDAPDVHKLVESCHSLDQNSRYLYLLQCSHFSKYTLTVKTNNGALVGFVSAYPHPRADDTLFIWQVAVASDYRKHGIAGRMIEKLIRLASENGISHIEATVTPSNTASMNLFRRIAASYKADFQQSVYFPGTLFDGSHEEELLIRIGPIKIKETN